MYRIGICLLILIVMLRPEAHVASKGGKVLQHFSVFCEGLPLIETRPLDYYLQGGYLPSVRSTAYDILFRLVRGARSYHL
jgi:hypothetical protein